MIRKIFAIDLTPCDMVARERGAHFFPVQDVRELIAGDDVDVLETLVTLVERVADDNPESIASNKMNFTRKQHALEEAGARVIRAPAKRLPDGASSSPTTSAWSSRRCRWLCACARSSWCWPPPTATSRRWSGSCATRASAPRCWPARRCSPATCAGRPIR